jgi:hypothetical protein
MKEFLCMLTIPLVHTLMCFIQFYFSCTLFRIILYFVARARARVCACMYVTCTHTICTPIDINLFLFTHHTPSCPSRNVSQTAVTRIMIIIIVIIIDVCTYYAVLRHTRSKYCSPIPNNNIAVDQTTFVRDKKKPSIFARLKCNIIITSYR